MKKKNPNPKNPKQKILTQQGNSNRCTESNLAIISKVLKYSVKHFQKVTLKRDKSQSQNCGMNSIDKTKKRQLTLKREEGKTGKSTVLKVHYK